MTRRFDKRLAILMLIGSLALIFHGCAALRLGEEPRVPLVYNAELPFNTQEMWPDEALQKAFVRYWATRYSDDPVKSFELEAPHTREMIATTRYNLFVKMAAQNELLFLEPVDQEPVSENFHKIAFHLHIKKPNGEQKKIFMVDRWVKVKGKWHHVFYEPVLFPESANLSSSGKMS